MLAHPPTKPMHCLVSAAMVLTLVGVCLVPLAFAGMESKVRPASQSRATEVRVE